MKQIQTVEEWNEFVAELPRIPRIEVKDWQTLHDYLDAWEWGKDWPAVHEFRSETGRYLGTFTKLPDL